MLARGILPITAVLFCTVSTQAQLSFTGSHDEDFDAMGDSGTTLPTGWSALRSSGSGTVGAPLTPGVTSGNTGTGGIYNVGSTGGPDRALGLLASGGTVGTVGLSMVNLTGALIEQLTLSGVSEQWRSGSSATAIERVIFEYSLDAMGIGDAQANWTPFPSLDLQELLLDTTSATALDGNLPENRVSFSGALDRLDWGDNEVLTLRWSDRNDTGSDGLYALDNLALRSSVTPVPEPAGIGTFAMGLGLLALYRRFSERSKAKARI